VIREVFSLLRRELVLRAHGSGRHVRAATADRGEMMPCPIPADWIDEGTPVARARGGAKAADGSVGIGEWDCTAGAFHWTYYEDELIRIVEGEVEIEVDGTFRTFGPNDTVFFPMGSTVRWRVPRYVRKICFMRRPGLLVEVLRKFSIRALLHGESPLATVIKVPFG
jgi:uncharacterized cupin superfamily protein